MSSNESDGGYDPTTAGTHNVTEEAHEQAPIDPVAQPDQPDQTVDKQNNEEAKDASNESVSNENDTDKNGQSEDNNEEAPNSATERADSRPPELASVEPSATPQPTLPPKRKRLPQDVIGQLEDRITDHPLDVDAWRGLINEIKKNEKPIDELREAYERMLKTFPLSAETWIDYIDAELANGEFYNVEQLFSRCLTKVLNLKLWTHYVGYVRRINDPTGPEGEKARNIITQMYEFVLDKVGIDREADSVWNEYLAFIRSKPTSSTWEEQQKMDLLRKTFRRAVTIPMNHLEQIWQSYNAFETKMGKTTARKFLAEKSGAYMNARSCLKEMETMTKQLDYNNTTPYPRAWTPQEAHISEQWMKWIEWEKSNPLESDEAAVQARVKYAYRQAVMSARYYPELWFSFAEYILSDKQSNTSEAIDILNSGIQANSTSFLLFYKLAELYERDGKFEDMKDTFTRLISNLKTERARIIRDKEENGGHAVEQLNTEDDNARDVTSAYIVYMKTVKRSQGIKEARRIFGEGRKLAYCTHHIYVASAMMEYYNDRSSGISTKIFEIGLKRFANDSEFIREYFDFLVLTNDDTNARALFEKTVSRMSPEDAYPLFVHFLQYEASFGELGALLKLETRFKEIYKGTRDVDVFSWRYKTNDYDPISAVDLGNRFQARKIDQVLPPARNGTANGAEDGPPSKRTRDEQGYGIDELQTTALEMLPESILNLLEVLPPAASYDTVQFDSDKLVQLIQSI